MTVKIAMRLHGLDLRDVSAYERIPAELTELSFQANGAVSIAVLYTDSPAPAAEAADWVRRIRTLMPGVQVVRVHDELVSVSDVAARCGVAAEAVRLWAAGRRRSTALRPFPPPRDVIGFGTGGKAMNVYAWTEVVAWVREVIGVDPDSGVRYLDDRQAAHLNAQLSDMDDGSDWQSLDLPRDVTSSVSSSGAVSSNTVTLLSRIDEVLVEQAPRPETRRASCR